MEISLLPDATHSDPSQFLLPWDTTFETLTLVILMAFIVERVLAMIYETKGFIEFKKRYEHKISVKPFIASLVSVIISIAYEIDVLAVLTSQSEASLFGCFITGVLISGGSKASIKLFRDFLDIKSTAYRKYEDDRDSNSP